MPSGKTLRLRARGSTACHRVGASSIAAVALLGALSPTAAWAGAKRPGDGDLSPRLAELANPSVRTLPLAKQAQVLGLPQSGPGSLRRDGSRVVVTVRFGRGLTAGIDGLRATGAQVLDVSRRYRSVAVAIGPADLHRLADLRGALGITEALAPVLSGTSDPEPITAAMTPCFGAATSEGDVQLRAQEARELFDVDGTGVTVGILSDSFNQDSEAPTDAVDDIASGDLPGAANPCEREEATTVFDDSEAEGTDEGRAMAQIVHDLAPGAKLAFATAFTPTMFDFADNIRKLAEPVSSGGAEADVIVDDVLFFEEPFFQEGPVGVAVKEVTEEGVSYFSSAGNNNLLREGRDIGSWEGPEFRDAASCPPGLPPWAQHCMDFDPGASTDPTFGVTVSAGEKLQVDLQWAQPWNGVTTDFDAYLVDASDTLLTDSGYFNVTSTQIPFEFLSWTNTSGTAETVRIAINRCDAVCGGLTGGDTSSPRLKFVLFQNGGGVTKTEYEEPLGEDVIGPTVFGHNGAADAISLGAIRYNASAAPEAFSSRGPVTHYFGPADDALPAAPLGAPHVIAKPDLVATDGGANTFFGSNVFGTWRFFGTSAAAPHAAAIAALECEALPAATAADVKQAQRESAAPVGAFPPEAVGAGRLDAVAAIQTLAASVAETPFSTASCGVESEPEPKPDQPDSPDPGAGNPPPGPGPGNPPSGDTSAPATFLRQRPPKVLRTTRLSAKATFKFDSNESGVTFLCKFDRKAFRICLRRTVRSFALGPHVLRVKARDAAGNTDPTPATYRFRVQRVG